MDEKKARLIAGKQESVEEWMLDYEMWGRMVRQRREIEKARMATASSTYTLTLNDLNQTKVWWDTTESIKPKCTRKGNDLLCEKCFERPLKCRTKKQLIDNYNRIVKNHGMPAVVHFLNLLAPMEKEILDGWIAERAAANKVADSPTP